MRKIILSSEELVALRRLCNLAEQELDRSGPWDELSDALDVFAPLVYKNWQHKKWHSKELTCSICGKQGDDVKTVIDPYDADVNNEEIEKDLCSECYYTRAEDV